MSIEKNNYTPDGLSLYYNTQKPHPQESDLTIQRLRKTDTLQSLDLAQNTYARKLSNGTLLSGLREYTRIPFGTGETPAYIFDEHNHAFFAWHEALSENRIQKGAILLHIDQHGDENYPSTYNFDPHNLGSIADYTSHLRIVDFIAPALYDGLFSKVIWIDPTIPRQEQQIYSANSNRIPYTIAGMDSQSITEIKGGRYSPQQLVVDLDIDYFHNFLTNPYAILPQGSYTYTEAQNQAALLLQNDIANIQSVFSQAGVITMATSPGFIDQTKAIDLIKNIFK